MSKLDRLAGLDEAIVRNVARGLFSIGELIAVEAQISITTGSVSGKAHVPSKPGEPPNNDTGVLANNIEVQQPEPLRVQVVAGAPYAAALEMGTSKMAARPFMAPAREQTREEAQQRVAKIVNSAMRRHFRR